MVSATLPLLAPPWLTSSGPGPLLFLLEISVCEFTRKTLFRPTRQAKVRESPQSAACRKSSVGKENWLEVPSKRGDRKTQEFVLRSRRLQVRLLSGILTYDDS